MASKAQVQLPTITVIHYDVGSDRSISVKEFLRSLRRVPCDSLAERRERKQKLCKQQLELQSRTQVDTQNTSLLVAHDDTGFCDRVDQIDRDEEPRRRKPTHNTSQDTMDLDYKPHALSAGTTGPNRTPNQRLHAQKPLSEIRQDIRLSKSRVIDPAEFKIPPATPSTSKRAAWRPGSGFKKGSRRHAPSGERSSPVQQRRNVNVDTRAPPLQAPNTAIPISTTLLEEVPAIQDVAHLEMPQTLVTRKMAGEHSPTRRVSLQPAPHATDPTDKITTPDPTVYDPHKHKFNMSSPLKRGRSFILTPRAEIRGDLTMGISRRLERTTTLPFIPPFKKTA
ncbi:MAG: hypothetical protein Q9221_000875 [Calogaya cf. arnoldii]